MLRRSVARLMHPAAALSSLKNQFSTAHSAADMEFFKSNAAVLMNNQHESVVEAGLSDGENMRNVTVFLLSAAPFSPSAEAVLLKQCTEFLGKREPSDIDIVSGLNLTKALLQMQWADISERDALLTDVLAPCLVQHLAASTAPGGDVAPAAPIGVKTQVSLMMMLQKMPPIAQRAAIFDAVVGAMDSGDSLRQLGQKELLVLINTAVQVRPDSDRLESWCELVLQFVQKNPADRFVHSATDHHAQQQVAKRMQGAVSEYLLLLQLLQQPVPLPKQAELAAAVSARVNFVVANGTIRDIVKLFMSLAKLQHVIDAEAIQAVVPALTTVLERPTGKHQRGHHFGPVEASLLLLNMGRLRLSVPDALFDVLVVRFKKGADRAGIKNLVPVLQQIGKRVTDDPERWEDIGRICTDIVQRDAASLTPVLAANLLVGASAAAPATVVQLIAICKARKVLFAGETVDTSSLSAEAISQLATALGNAVTMTMEEESELERIRGALKDALLSTSGTSGNHALVQQIRAVLRTESSSTDEQHDAAPTNAALAALIAQLAPRINELDTMYDVATVCRACHSLKKHHATSTGLDAAVAALGERLQMPTSGATAYALLGILSAMPFVTAELPADGVAKVASRFAEDVKAAAPSLNAIELNTMLRALVTMLNTASGEQVVDTLTQTGTVAALIRRVSQLAPEMTVQHVSGSMSLVAKLTAATTVEATQPTEDGDAADGSFTLQEVAAARLGSRFLELLDESVPDETLVLFVTACTDASVLIRAIPHIRSRANSLSDVQLTLTLTALAKNDAWNRRSLRAVAEETRTRAASADLKTVASALRSLVPLCDADVVFRGPDYDSRTNSQLSEGVQELLPHFIRRLQTLVDRLAGEELTRQEVFPLWLAARALLKLNYPPQPLTSKVAAMLLDGPAGAEHLTSIQALLLLQDVAARSSVPVDWEATLATWLPKLAVLEQDPGHFVLSLALVARTASSGTDTLPTGAPLMAKCAAVASSVHANRFNDLLSAAVALDAVVPYPELVASIVSAAMSNNRNIFVGCADGADASLVPGMGHHSRLFPLASALLAAQESGDPMKEALRAVAAALKPTLAGVKPNAAALYRSRAAVALSVLAATGDDSAARTKLVQAVGSSMQGVSFSDAANLLRAVRDAKDCDAVRAKGEKLCVIAIRREPLRTVMQQCSMWEGDKRVPASWLRAYPELEDVVRAKMQ